MNNKMILGIIFLISLVIMGCGEQKQPIKDVNPSQEYTDSLLEVHEAEEPEPKQEHITKPTVDEPEQELDTNGYNFDSFSREEQSKIKLVRKLLDQARTSDENYFFRYSGPDVLQTDVWVKGNKLKRSIHRDNELDKYKTYNMVYMNRDSLIAKGYCETTKSKCFEGNGPFTETFSKWNIKTPKDWVMDLDDDFRWALDNKISDQLYHIIDYNKDGQTIRVYVNDYKGWPYRVEIHPGTNLDSITTRTAEEMHLYDDMDIGGVSDDDVTPG